MPRSAPPPEWVLTRRRVIGERIRATRTAVGLTQQDVAERIPATIELAMAVERPMRAPVPDDVGKQSTRNVARRFGDKPEAAVHVMR